MNRKQKKELRQHQSTRQLMGIEQLTEHGIKTARGELIFISSSRTICLYFPMRASEQEFRH